MAHPACRPPSSARSSAGSAASTRPRLSSNRPLLLTNAGPLVRYGMTSLLANLLDTGTRRPAARWLLVAKAGDARAPLLEGRSVPLGPSGWIDLPRDMAQLADDEATKLQHSPSTGDPA